MCTNFIPTASDMLVQFSVEHAPFDHKEEANPGYDAPFIAHIARAETVGQRRSFRNAWKNHLHCLKPLSCHTVRSLNQ